MKKLLTLLALLVACQNLPATSVVPPTFDQLVGQAEAIFHGRVTSVHSLWVGEGSQRHIDTLVTFEVADAMKGGLERSYTIRMFGGTVGDESMGISDAPEFQVGDEDILFVENNGSQVVPLVGIMHGRFRVVRDENGSEAVLEAGHEAVRDVAQLGQAEESVTPLVGRHLSAAEFKAAIRSRLQSLPGGVADQHQN